MKLTRRSLLAALPVTLAAAENGHSAPEFIGRPEDWINTQPLTLASRQGRITVVHFWTFGCINCKRNLPSYNRWQAAFAGKDVAIVGIHTPEFDHERNPENVRRFVQANKIEYPVLLDPEMKNWRRWQQEYWPVVYVVNGQNRIHTRWIGELEHNNAGGERKIAEIVRGLAD